MTINKHTVGLVGGAFFGLAHVAWSLLVWLGLAQSLINRVFELHFIQPPFTVGQFSLSVAVVLIVIASLVGYVFGWLLAAIWNWLHAQA